MLKAKLTTPEQTERDRKEYKAIQADLMADQLERQAGAPVGILWRSAVLLREYAELLIKLS